MKPRDEMLGESVLGRYRIVARIAQGGMGVVYLARAEGAAGFAKPVVVKRVLPDLTGDERMARLFVREAKILANLQHPNIVSVIDFGEEDGAYIMVLDYVRAYHLGLWLAYRQEKKEQLPVECVLHIIIKVLDALEYAHSLMLPDGTPLEIVHADVSPANILVDTDGQVKLLDFGIARMKGEATQSTDSKSIRGKFAYLPVEALDGSPPKVATDVYACAVTLYELLTGENPFTGVDETRTIARVISHEAAPPSQLRPGLPTQLDDIILRAMSKDPTKRFATAKDFARELRKVQTVPEDQAAPMLAEMAKRDYLAMPTRGASITELEDAWRNPSQGPIGKTPKDSQATRAAAANMPVTPVWIEGPAPRRRTALVIGLAAGGLVAVGGIGTAVALMNRAPPEEPKFVLIERGGGGTTSTVSSAVAVPPAAAPSTTDSVGSASLTTASAARAPDHAKPPAKGGDPLSGALAKNGPEIEACFRDKVSDLTGNPEVSVRFTIDKEGAVQRAELSPSELTNTGLGQCVLGVAKKTHFPPQQSEPVTFRIPLRARKL